MFHPNTVTVSVYTIGQHKTVPANQGDTPARADSGGLSHAAAQWWVAGKQEHNQNLALNLLMEAFRFFLIEE